MSLINSFDLPKSGICPICHSFYKGLKLHYKTCYFKNNCNIDIPPELSQRINSGLFDFDKNKYRCEFCSVNYFKRLDSKAYENHIAKKHGRLSDNFDFFPLVGDDFFESDLDLVEPTNLSDVIISPSYLNLLVDEVIPDKFNYMLLNINSLLGSSKLSGVQDILHKGIIDMFIIQESKIGTDVPDSLFDFNYNIIRRDRVKGSGGIIIFLKKQYQILSKVSDEVYETIVLSLKIKHRSTNFIIGYNPHFEFSSAFNNHISILLRRINLKHPTFIVGDLNQDLLTKRGDFLRSLLDDYGFGLNYVEPTHWQGNSASFIDVSSSNDEEAVLSTTVVPCPFSNHAFILTICNFSICTSNSGAFRARVLNEVNLERIRVELKNINTDFIEVFDDVNDRWAALKQLLLNIIDDVAPLKNFRKKNKNNLPWIDSDCLYMLAQRDIEFKKATSLSNDRSSFHWDKFKSIRNRCKSLLRRKMNAFFENKTSKFFDHPKNYWKFYRKYYKSKKDHGSGIVSIDLNDDRTIHSDNEIASEFNNYISSLCLPSDKSDDDCFDFVQSNFNKLKSSNLLEFSTEFKFVHVSSDDVLKHLEALDIDSSAGITGIPVKIFKFCANELSDVFSRLFNFCFLSASLPNEWKQAIVSPLYKGKGSATSFDNYRGISCLPPIGKVFEKLVAKQVMNYFEVNNLFTTSQHGFRSNHSCETAILSMIDKWKNNINDKLLNMVLFIDFKKAFDLINPKLLFLKLFQYGFDNNSLGLFKDYFQNRLQHCKVSSALSDKVDITIGVPQGSVLGPLLFLIFINDIAYCSDLSCFLFADDTTLFESGHDPLVVIDKLKVKLLPIIEWVKFNQLSINWGKTKLMCISNSRISCNINSVTIDNHSVDVVDSFKLLGVHIDRYLSFNTHLTELKKSVNKKLFSLKKLHFLSISTKLHFFKAFIYPHFDYCSSIFVFYNKILFSNLEKFFDLCLYRLFNFRLFDLDASSKSKFLSRYNLFPLNVRFFLKMSKFCYKILNRCILNNFFINLSFKDSSYFRDRELVCVPDIRSSYGRLTFNYFLPKFINSCLRHSYNLPFNLFNQFLYNNLEINFSSFIREFSIFS